MTNVAHIHSHPYLHSHMNIYTMNSHIYTTRMYLHTHHTCTYRMESMLLVVRAMHEEIEEMPLQAGANYEVDL